MNENKLKITKLSDEYGSRVHFKYDGIDYFLNNGERESTCCISLYKGRCKGKLEHLISTWGIIMDLIVYDGNGKNRTLNHIDKKHFINKLYESGIAKYFEKIEKNLEDNDNEN